jgi:hypothetical protein
MNSQIEDKQDFDSSSEDFEQYSSVIDILKKNLDNKEITLRPDQQEQLTALIDTVEEPKWVHYQLFKKLAVAAVLLIIGVIVFEISRPEALDSGEAALAINSSNESGVKKTAGVDSFEEEIVADSVAADTEQVDSGLVVSSRNKDAVDSAVASLAMKEDTVRKKSSDFKKTDSAGPRMMSIQRDAKSESSEMGVNTTSAAKADTMQTRNRSVGAKVAAVRTEETEDDDGVEVDSMRSKAKSSKELSVEAKITKFQKQAISEERKRFKGGSRSQKLVTDDNSVKPIRRDALEPTIQLVNINFDATFFNHDIEVKGKVFYFGKDSKLVDSKLSFATRLLPNPSVRFAPLPSRSGLWGRPGSWARLLVRPSPEA